MGSPMASCQKKYLTTCFLITSLTQMYEIQHVSVTSLIYSYDYRKNCAKHLLSLGSMFASNYQTIMNTFHKKQSLMSLPISSACRVAYASDMILQSHCKLHHFIIMLLVMKVISFLPPKRDGSFIARHSHQHRMIWFNFNSLVPDVSFRRVKNTRSHTAASMSSASVIV